MSFGNFFMGTPSSIDQVTTQSKGQQGLSNQLMQMLQSGGGMGGMQNYFNQMLGNDESSFNQFAAPEMRRFNQEIIPSLANQFAGMGSGALSSSGFRNAAVGAGADLSERLASMRANLRQNAVGQLGNFYGQSQQPQFENVYRPRSPGLLEQLAPIAGQALGSMGGQMGGMAGQKLMSKLF